MSRILMVSAHYPPVLNGYAIQCRDTADRLAERGHDVTVLTGPGPLPDGGARRLPRLRNAAPEGYVSLRPSYLARQLRRRAIYRANARTAGETAAELRPDVALIWQFDSLGLGLVQALQREGVPVAFNVGDTTLATFMSLLQLGSPLGRRIRPWLYDIDPAALDLSHLILVSQALLDWYAEQGFPRKHMTVIHNGIPETLIATEPSSSGPGTRLLFAGRLHPTKGLHVALEALAFANGDGGPRLTLDVAGSGDHDYERELVALTAELGLAGDVRFLGATDRAAVMDLYREHDILVFPSVWEEPFGLVVVEAMAQGLPVVALDRGAPSELISDGEDGVLVPGESPEAFARAIRRVAGSRTLRESMGAAAIRTVRERYTLERHVDGIERLLGELAG